MINLKFVLLTFIISFNCLASFSDKEVDRGFMHKLFQTREHYYGEYAYFPMQRVLLMEKLQKNERDFQLFVNFEKKIISWVNYLDASESNEIFSSEMRKWREGNESCSKLILVKELEKEMKKYDEKTQALYFFLLAYRNQSMFTNKAYQFLNHSQVEGTRSYDSNSYLKMNPSRNMNAIVKTLTWFSNFITINGASHIEEYINEAIQTCERLPEISEIFPNWDMEEIQRMMNIEDDEEMRSALRLFMDSAWTPNINFLYGERSAMALYPYLDIRFNKKERSPRFIKNYFDSMVDIYERSEFVDGNLCKAFNAPLSLASMLGFDVDPLKKEYSFFTQKDFEKWMVIKASFNVAAMKNIKNCKGTLRYIDNVWGSSSILPNPGNSIVRTDDSRYMGKTNIKLYYYPKWQVDICMKGTLKGEKGSEYVQKSDFVGFFGCR